MEKPCYTCRRRHIQCDRTQTPCLKCQKAGQECHDERPVRWVQGIAVRGNMRGRSYQNSSVYKKPIMSIQSRPVSKTDTPSFPNGITPLSIPLSMKDGTLSQLEPSSRYYLDYCMYWVDDNMARIDSSQTTTKYVNCSLCTIARTIHSATSYPSRWVMESCSMQYSP